MAVNNFLRLFEAPQILAQVQDLIQKNIQALVSQGVVALATRQDPSMVAYLNTPSRQTGDALSKTLTQEIIAVAVTNVTQQGASIAGGVAVDLLMKAGGQKLIQHLAGLMARFVTEKLTPGSIPDDMAAQSKLLQAFDLPDGVAARLSIPQRTHLIAILGLIRNKPDLFKTEWAVLNSIGTMGTTQGAQGQAMKSQQVQRQVATTRAA